MFRRVFFGFQSILNNPLLKLPINSGNYIQSGNSIISRLKSTLDSSETDKVEIPGAIATRYEPFSEESAPIILDIEEERQKIDESYKETFYNEFEGISLERGVTGVFEIEEFVNILRRENASDIVVIKLPSEYRYADYMVIVTGKSVRHMLALLEFLKKIYKKKRKPSDTIPAIEGKSSKDWMAMDLGNIVLHVFTKQCRDYYDLETLWSLGKEYDTKTTLSSSSIYTDYSNLLASLNPDTAKNPS